MADFFDTVPEAVSISEAVDVLQGFQVNADESLSITESLIGPPDLLGNPTDPVYQAAIYQTDVSLLQRSIFTDKGPIARPPLTLQTGTSATLDGFDTVTLTGATLTVSDIGKRVTLTNSASNDGTFVILSIVDTDTAKVKASFTLPDANDGAIDWEVYDPRNGQIADLPSEVTVRVNGSPVTPQAVIGLRGQIVLETPPDPADTVEVDYCWICNPTVEIRRLNSKEFHLNGWNRDHGGVNDSKHHYRYNNVLVTPSAYEPSDLKAGLAAPQLRQLKYRAYERAYSALLNDPNRLLLNTPTHRIAYPPASRTLSESSVFYEGLTLPENDIATPWTREGTGTASVIAGVLTVQDTSTGDFPTGEPLFWTQNIDLTFPHVFSAAWRFSLDTVTTLEGVWTGIAAGYSTDQQAFVVGYIDDGGTKKIGFLKRGAEDQLGEVTSWVGGLDGLGDPTNAPVDFDWSILHSYRIFTDQNGRVSLYVDGDIVPTLRITPSEAPFLEELNAPFDAIQGVFFGSLSRPAQSTSNWDFYRYLIQPINSQQTSPSSFVSYEANVLPELDPSPWTPVGFHGTSTVLSADTLEVSSTSATDPALGDLSGLVGGDFRGYVKIEPLLSLASEFALDFDVQLLSHTHDYDPNGLMVGIDDGTRLMQLSFLSDTAAPKVSYGGRSLPTDFSPYVWSELGSETVELVGRRLKITDTSAVDGKVYFIEDTAPAASADRVAASGIDYAMEAQLRVETYTPDGGGFCGAFFQAFDGSRNVGFYLREVAGIRYVAFHSDGVDLGAQFAFEWADGEYHTYRFRKSTTGNLVSLFVDGVFVGSLAYSSFSAPPPDAVGIFSFGSSTAASSQAASVVEWSYCNAWRILATERRYIGLWKGTSNGDLRDYHVPEKVSGVGATANGNNLVDASADFITANVLSGDLIVVDTGANAGVYQVNVVGGANNLTLTSIWPAQPTLVDYRIVKQTDWSVSHKYRLLKDPGGSLSVFLDTETLPEVSISYNSVNLPGSVLGLQGIVSNRLPSIAFGSFSTEDLSRSQWDFVRYGITRSPTELRIVPPHHVLNQWNVMESPERLFTTVSHVLTDFKSSSTGITPQTEVDFLDNTSIPAFTQLNEGTPLVPQTQNFETRGPFATSVYVSTLNNPEDVLNNDGDFLLNDASQRFEVVVPEDVLYTSLKITETSTGDLDLIRPFGDECGPRFGSLQYQNEVCLTYTADTLPENDTTAASPWTLNSDDPGEVSASVLGGILTYGTSGTGTKTVYLNNTPLPDAPSLQTEASFRLRLASDATGGTGDSQVRFGISAPGLTLALGFVTTILGERLVIAYDLNSGSIVSSIFFDYLDGLYHTYRIVLTPQRNIVEILIEGQDSIAFDETFDNTFDETFG